MDRNRQIKESIIPYNLDFHTNVKPEQTTRTLIGDPGAAIAQAFIQGLNNTPPKVEIPKPKMSKQDNYWKDVTNNMAPIPTFGIEDTRPETSGELQAQLYPKAINEPLEQEFISKPNEFIYSDNGTSVLDYDFTTTPINGMPNIKL